MINEVEIMRQPKILVVGSLVMDLITSTEKFLKGGETVLGCGFRTATGGNGANQALQARRLGADVTMVGKTGTDAFGQELVQALQSAGVHTEHILSSPEHPSAVGNIMITLQNGVVQNNRIVVVSGANMAISLEDLTFLEDTIRAYDMVMLQLEIPMEINCYVAELAHRESVPVMLNSAPISGLPASLLQNIRCISPNEHEAAVLTGCDLSRDDRGFISEAQLRRATDRLHSLGIPEVIITLGHQGSVYSNGMEWFQSPSMKGVSVADPTAAGDSYVGAYCFATCCGLTPRDASMFASCTAAITVSRMGAQPSLPTLEEVLSLAKSHGMRFDSLPSIS